jgi:hypothetical protein
VYFDGAAVNTISLFRKNVGISIDSIEGWEGGYELRDVREQLAGRDGERADALLAGGRTITINGMVYGASWEDVQSRKRDLAAIFAHNSTEGLLKVPDPTSSVESSFYEYANDLSPVAYWRLGESSGTSALSATGSYTGTIAGNPTLGSEGAITADEDTCIDFDGTGDYVQVAYAAALNPSTFTVSAWACVDGGAGTSRGVCGARNAGSTAGWRLYATAANVWSATLYDAGGQSAAVVSSTAATVGEWFHLALKYDGTTLTFYINGASVGTSTDTFVANSTDDFFIGAYDEAIVAPFNGKIDDVLLFNTPLTTDQILQLYRRGSGEVANNDTTGYEHSTCRVIDPVRFGDHVGLGACPYTVVLRASDPRIYHDYPESGSGAGVAISNGGQCEAPVTLTCTMQSGLPSVEIDRIAADTGGQIGFILDRLSGSDVVVVRTGDRTADWTTTYHNGRLKLFDPIAYWRLNETSGTTADNCEGTSSYDGTYTNTPTLNQSGHASSIVSTSFDDASSEYVTVPFAAALNPAVFSIEAWCLFDDASGAGAIAGSFRNNGGAYTGWSLRRSGNSLVLQWWTGSGTTEGSLQAFTALDAATWYHIVAVMGEDGPRLYIDGELQVAISFTNAGAVFSPVTASSAFTIGRVTDGGGNAYIDGKIDNVALYAQALTKQQVADLYAASAASATFENYGGYVIEPAMTEWFNIPVGTTTIDEGSLQDLAYSFREARL